MNFVTVTELKRQVKIDLDNNDDNIILQSYIDVATQQLFDLINRNVSGFTGSTLPINLKHAIVYLAADYNEFRESKSRQQVYKVPDTVDSLIYTYINYGDRY